MLTNKAIIDLWRSSMRLHRKIVERKIGKLGIHHGQHRLLMNLARRDWNSQKELADHMEVSTATMAVSLKKLEKGGYIKRAVIPDDNRYNQLEITEKGRKVVKESSRIFDEIDEQIFNSFSKQEKEELLGYMQRINANLLYLQEEEKERRQNI